MKSIIQKDETCCAVCGCAYGLHKHHIYGGANRSISEKNGFVVHLCGRHHNLSNEGVHFNHELDLRFKRMCQAKFEETHTRSEFMRLIGKNYIWDDEPEQAEEQPKWYIVKFQDGDNAIICDSDPNAVQNCIAKTGKQAIEIITYNTIAEWQSEIRRMTI